MEIERLETKERKKEWQIDTSKQREGRWQRCRSRAGAPRVLQGSREMEIERLETRDEREKESVTDRQRETIYNNIIPGYEHPKEPTRPQHSLSNIKYIYEGEREREEKERKKAWQIEGFEYLETIFTAALHFSFTAVLLLLYCMNTWIRAAQWAHSIQYQAGQAKPL
jgi:hypothetical protein